MRKKNRKIPKKLSVVASSALHFAAVIVMLFVMVILNLLASSSCNQLMKAIGDKRRVLAKLEEERVRESARWEEMKTPERLEGALLRHGLSMRYPHHDQVIRMRTNGTPYPSKTLASLRKRSGDQSASFEPKPSRYRSAVSGERYGRVR